MSLTQAYELGLYQLFDYLLMRTIYIPYSIQMNLDCWNEMEPELQDLISNTILPEVQEYVKGVVVDQHKQAALGLNDNLNAIHVIPMEREQEAWEMLQTQPDFLARKALLDPEIVALINALRPAIPTLDQEIIDILTYAGIPLPS